MKIITEREGRLDSFAPENISRSYFEKLIKDGLVKVDGKIINKKSYKVPENAKIEIELPEHEEITAEAEEIPLDIVYQDEDILVINKAKGMVTHPSFGNYTGTVVNAILGIPGLKLSGINGKLRPGIVHRLDRNTSGLLIIAINDEAHKNLTEQFKNKTVEKEYIAIVHGIFKEKMGHIENYIGRHPKDRKKFAVIRSPQKGKLAITVYEVLDEKEDISLVKVRIKTGRTHQIRVHMSALNHPIIGDDVYGKGKNKWGIKGQMLHAKKLSFLHPRTGEKMEFETEMPEEFETVWGIASRSSE
jgi:23S rRNA pseudouridine1911/1915/1917 synthase